MGGRALNSQERLQPNALSHSGSSANAARMASGLWNESACFKPPEHRQHVKTLFVVPEQLELRAPNLRAVEVVVTRPETRRE